MSKWSFWRKDGVDKLFSEIFVNFDADFFERALEYEPMAFNSKESRKDVLVKEMEKLNKIQECYINDLKDELNSLRMRNRELRAENMELRRIKGV